MAKKKNKGGFIIAIDGPAGAGKSTVSKLLAEELGGMLLDTGAMYRSVAYFGLKAGAKTESDFSLIAKSLTFRPSNDKKHVLVNGVDLGLKLRSPKVSEAASSVSRYKLVRDSLTRRQRVLGKSWSKKFPVVLEGRDIGTVVFPQAEYKFYVTADPKVRALRRFKQLKKSGTQTQLAEIIKQNQIRDDQDSQRKYAPLKCAADAVVVDTSRMGIVQVVKFMAEHIRAHRELV